MAQRIIKSITDDIDGSEDARTVTFAFEGRSYEVDLSAKNRDKLAKALEPYIKAGRAASTSRRTVGSRTSGTTRHNTTAIREWAKANGHKVSDRGRIAAEVLQAYEAAH